MLTGMKTESKTTVSRSLITQSRFRTNTSSSTSKIKTITINKEEDETINGGEGASSANSVHKSKPRKSHIVNRPKSVSLDTVVTGSPTPKNIRELESCKVVDRSGCRSIVQQFSRPTVRRTEPLSSDGKTKKNSNTRTKSDDLQEKLALSESSIKNLQSQVLALKSELEKAHCLNAELQSQNEKLIQDLAADQVKESIGEYQNPKFKDIQKLIANKLEHPKFNQRETISKPTTSKSSSSSLENPVTIAVSTSPSDPPPPPPLPPPPPPLRPLPKASTTQKPPTFVDFYHSLTKSEAKKDLSGQAVYRKTVAVNAHSSIVGEIENRSAHLMAIKADIETKGEFINDLIQRVINAAYTDIEAVLKFADWLDKELASLADERAVLKHFKWPEKKADAIREAAIEYRELRMLECEISLYKDDFDLPCGAALKKITSLLDKSERSIQKLFKLRNSVMIIYRDYKIPVDWMLDSGIVKEIKNASMKLAKMYMNRVTKELESIRNSERESAQEALLLQGVHFAYRAHQFAGGLDAETLCALEAIRQRVPGHLVRAREILSGIHY